jgi:conjugative relaxase-like TrwC/TraI family protein
MKGSYKKLSGAGGAPWEYYFSLMERDENFRAEVLEWLSGQELVGDLSAVTREDMASLMSGFAPDKSPVLEREGFIPTPVSGVVPRGLEGRALVSNAGQLDRVPGYDLTFSAPKSVSLAWAACQLAGDTERAKAIEMAVLRASEAAIGYLREADGFRSMVNNGESVGLDVVPVARVMHVTSRNGDPQIHGHNVIPNAGLEIGPDIRGRAIASKFFLDRLGGAEQLARVALADELTKAGFAFLREGDVVEIAGVPRELRDTASSRRALAKEMARVRGHDPENIPPAVMDSMLALSRKPKEPEAASQEREYWEQLFRDQGIDPRVMIEQVRGPVRDLVGDEKAVRAGIEDRLPGAVILSRPEVDEAVFKEATGRLDALAAMRLSGELIRGQHPEIWPLSAVNSEREPHEYRFTTPGLAAAERRVIENTIDRADDWHQRSVEDRRLEEVFARLEASASDRDVKAAMRIGGGRSGVALMEGPGYARAFEPMARGFMEAGCSVRRYSEDPKRATPIQGDATRRAVQEHSFDTLDEKPRLSAKSVVVVEQAERLAPKRLDRLLTAARDVSAKVILAARTKVLAKRAGEVSPISTLMGAASLFGVDAARLCGGRFAAVSWQVEAAQRALLADSRGALELFARHGAIVGHRSQPWLERGVMVDALEAQRDGQEHIAITADDATADRLNGVLRASRDLGEGIEIPVQRRTGKADVLSIAEGERIMLGHDAELAGGRIVRGQILEVIAVGREGKDARFELRVVTPEGQGARMEASWDDLRGGRERPEIRHAYAMPAYMTEAHEPENGGVQGRVSAVLEAGIGDRVAALMVTRATDGTRLHVEGDLKAGRAFQVIDEILREPPGRTLSSYMRPHEVAQWIEQSRGMERDVDQGREHTTGKGISTRLREEQHAIARDEDRLS